MRVIKSIVFSNIWIALGASCYTLHTFQIANLEINYLLLSLIFSATLFSYNFQRVVRLNKIDGDKSERHLWLQKYTTLLKFVIATSFLMSAMLSVYVFTISQLLLMSIPFLLVVFYATFLTNKKKGLRIKGFAFCQNFHYCTSLGCNNGRITIFSFWKNR